MSNEDPVLLERDGEVAIISLNRPERMNAVGPTTLDDLAKLADQVSADPSVRAVVLAGKGRAFCAGADLVGAEDRGAPAQPLRERFPLREDSGWPSGWWGFNIPKPVVCAINGAAVGYGAELLATCDMRIAGESGRIGWVFAKRGLVTDMGVGPIVLPRLIGLSQTARLLFSGEIVGAQEALRIGLVDEVVPDSDLLARTIATARHLAEGAPVSVAVMKRQLYATLRDDPHEIYFENLGEFERSMASEDFREGVRSFMEKRQPAWTGR
jgi:enoyl-CoA hydratase/carnithine racemase